MRSEKREKHVAVLEQLGGDLPRFALLLKILKPFIGIPLDSPWNYTRASDDPCCSSNTLIACFTSDKLPNCMRTIRWQSILGMSGKKRAYFDFSVDCERCEFSDYEGCERFVSLQASTRAYGLLEPSPRNEPRAIVYLRLAT